MNFSFLKNPFLAGIIAGIIMLFLALINKKLSSEKNNPEYVKLFLSSGLITGAITFLSNMNTMIGGNPYEETDSLINNNKKIYTNSYDNSA